MIWRHKRTNMAANGGSIWIFGRVWETLRLIHGLSARDMSTVARIATTASKRASTKRIPNRRTANKHGAKPMASSNLPEATVSKGEKEVTIEAVGQNPAFTPDSDMAFRQRVYSFAGLGLRDDVLKALDALNIHQPTVIQMVTIPKIIHRHHVICAAQTGSGKTLAYLAPLVHRLREDEERHGILARLKRPRACIVVPARELATQILKTAKSLCHHARFRSVGLIGGRKQKWMRDDLESPVDLLVATPGTLLKYRQKDRLFFSDLTHLVIDEADTMFDASFKSLTMEILHTIKIRECQAPPPDQLPIDAQVTIAGATLPQELIANTLKDLLPHLETCSSGLHRVLPHVRHKFIKLNQHEKAERIVELLKKDSKSPGQTIVFCNSASSCDWLARHLEQHNLSLIRLHGNIPPKIRCERFEKFQNKTADILVCTDIASRGLDTSDVSHVINFDFPNSMVDYIHRVGRTGRVSHVTPQVTSRATSFISHNRDARMSRAIQHASQKNISLDITGSA
ncbi:DEAD-box ATP-dependent RNA helicase 39 isoform X1 [Nematostella vectensis]|uniref:DEAD-box ATP-dependent RNA helicase 39 isoform X1 n=1 Tax=Nematostella vectensis TaxID=45351 RepID=UPI002076E956|nr:DEAD-box ATP-dependent RNA helicase 39 isoform X1 [Nematostella vectensis]